MSEARAHDDDRRARRPGRKLAERVTMMVSTALVVGVAAFLGSEVARERQPFVPVEVQPLLEEAREAQGRYILPVEVRNRGGRTVQDFKGQVVYRTRDGQQEKREFQIDYLGEQATQKIYLYFEDPPRDLQVQAAPESYILE